MPCVLRPCAYPSPRSHPYSPPASSQHSSRQRHRSTTPPTSQSSSSDLSPRLLAHRDNLSHLYADYLYVREHLLPGQPPPKTLQEAARSLARYYGPNTTSSPPTNGARLILGCKSYLRNTRSRKQVFGRALAIQKYWDEGPAAQVHRQRTITGGEVDEKEQWGEVVGFILNATRDLSREEKEEARRVYEEMELGGGKMEEMSGSMRDEDETSCGEEEEDEEDDEEEEEDEEDDESSEEIDFWEERDEVEVHSVYDADADADIDDGVVIKQEEEVEMTREQWNEISAWAEKVDS